MSMHGKIVFHPLPATPTYFDESKFKAGDETQIKIYKDNKTPNQKKKLTYEQISAEKYNYARQVPMNGCFIDYDKKTEFEIMERIIVRAKLKCLILETQRGGQFLFKKPDFYKKEMTGATNWFGYKFDTKASWINEKGKEIHAVQNMRVCGMQRIEFASWNLDTPIPPDTININELDELPYWLWGKGTDEKLFKDGKMGKIKDPDTGKELPAHDYKIDNSPFTKLMKMTEGGRHDYIFKYCRTFALYNGFLLDDFKAIIHAIHNEFLVKLGTPMSDSDLLGDINKGWETYMAELISSYHGSFDELKRIWCFEKEKTKDKVDERRASEYLFNEFDFYVRKPKSDGIYTELLYREKDGDYEYQQDLTKIRKRLREYSDQNFKRNFFEEVEVQLMQICAENKKLIRRSHEYIIVKNKILSCITPDAYDFSWLGTRLPTDVVFRWTWQSEQWVKEHEEDLGGNMTKFIKELSRNSKGIPQPEVEQWLWVVAGASMIPANSLEKIIVMAGGGQNGKSLYTSLIRLCLGEDMFNTSKIFDSNPYDNKFWGEDLDKGICCIVDDLPQHYDKDTFSYLKGVLTKSDDVLINEKHKPKKRLDVLPQIIACTNFEFKLYDKSEGMRRRVKILPTEYHIDDSIKDGDLQHKLVLNTTDSAKVSEYRMSEEASYKNGVQIMNMYTGEKGVLDSLNNGSLCWFANKARYEYFKAKEKYFAIGDSDGMKSSLDDTFKNVLEIECEKFIKWYVDSKCRTSSSRNLSKANCFFDKLYHPEYETYCEIMGIDKMKQGQFNIYCNKAIINFGYSITDKKNKDKGYACRYVVFSEEVLPSKSSTIV